MTIDEAIAHAEWCAENSCGECAEDHRQLAEWLKDLRERRSTDAALEDERNLLSERLGDYREALIFTRAENAKLRELVSVVYGYYASGTINPCDFCDAIGCQYIGEAESGCRYRDHCDSAEAAEDEIQRRMCELGIEVHE